MGAHDRGYCIGIYYSFCFMLTSKIATISWTIWMNVTLSRLQIGWCVNENKVERVKRE
jgi:hypothetical protein